MSRALLTLLLIPFAVHAETYAIVGAGFSKTDAAGSKQSTLPAYVGLGFRINKALAVEAAYSNLDSRNEHSSSAASTAINTTTVTESSTATKWSGKGAGLYLVGFRPVSSSVSLVGRIGAVRLKGETTTSTETVALDNTVGGGGAILSHTRSDVSTLERIWAPAVGIGLQEWASDRVAFRGMLERVVGHGIFKGATMLSVSLLLSF